MLINDFFFFVKFGTCVLNNSCNVQSCFSLPPLTVPVLHLHPSKHNIRSHMKAKADPSVRTGEGLEKVYLPPPPPSLYPQVRPPTDC